MMKKLQELESARGIASLVVLIHHFFLGFSPETTGLLAQTRTAESFYGNYFFWAFNGTAAVNFFFLLSGFVLTFKYFEGTKNDFGAAIVKRAPRLALLCIITMLVSCIFLKSGWLDYKSAAKISSSPWLADFAFAGVGDDFKPSIFSAIWQGCTTFFTGAATYNSNLWTMKIEFYGSILCFMMAASIVSIRSDLAKNISMLVILIFVVKSMRDFTPFIIGVCVAFLHSRKHFRLNFPVSALLLLAGLYFLGYTESVRDYYWVPAKSDRQIFVLSLGSLAVLVSLISSSVIASAFKTKWLIFLGRISFPLYAVHTLVIIFPASSLFVALAGHKALQLPATFLTTLALSFLVAYPLMHLDERWTKMLNNKTKGL